MRHAYDIALDLEENAKLDRAVDTLDKALPQALQKQPTRGLLEGTWLGHALHPLLTDVPLGCWMSATLLRLFGPARWSGAATTLTGIGVVAAVPTVATGVAEWQRATPAAKRVGVVHAVANSIGLGFYTASFVAGLRGKRGKATVTALLGGVVASVGGYLGGHLSFAQATGVDHARIEPHLSERLSTPLQAVDQPLDTPSVLP
ncbi:DUF2231 domain-containing protein [Egicoccus sp. AB-alg2]|uniref:DUF2231 domain-containing protein n=1 Tax=Egicoccus sp. AB-alg2 TaxID=3242693 RepID=UPI00359DDDCA